MWLLVLLHKLLDLKSENGKKKGVMDVNLDTLDEMF